MIATKLMEELQYAIANSPTIPFTGMCIVNKSEVLNMIKKLIRSFPEELDQAAWVKSKADEIIEDAQNKSKKIVKTAEDKVIYMIQDHEVVKSAHEKAKDVVSTAKDEASDIYNSSYSYANDMLIKAQESIIGLIDYLKEIETKIEKDREILVQIQSGKITNFEESEGG